LLFKGGTSLSKAFELIRRFSEDIDITVFREDLGEPVSIDDLEKMTGKKRKAKLDEIRAACQQYVKDELGPELGATLLEEIGDNKDENAVCGWTRRILTAKHFSSDIRRTSRRIRTCVPKCESNAAPSRLSIRT
jgi:hypothetical protein